MVNQVHFYNMPWGVTPDSHKIYHIHMLSFYICLGIFLLVTVLVVTFLIKYRKKIHAESQQIKPFGGIEVIWITVPFLLLVVMAIPATKFLFQFNAEHQPQLNVLITGSQWKWKYRYLDYDLEFFSNLATPLDQLQGKVTKGPLYLREVDYPLIVPTHQKIRFLVTSSDVIHSWWVPDLGIKRDAIPGFIYETWTTIERPGIYRGQCAELCGVRHGFMPIVVEAVDQNTFNVWITRNKSKKLNLLITEGKSIYVSQCSVCHQINGTGKPPLFPALQGSKVSIGALERHIDIVLNGKPQTAMPAFRDQLTNEQIAAVITYERNAWGNNNQLKYGFQAGGTVHPEEIARARQNQFPNKIPSLEKGS